MDYSKGKLYCQLLIDGENEETIAQKSGISLHDLYRIIEFTDINIARKYLKYFCDGYINYVCLSWPGVDESCVRLEAAKGIALSKIILKGNRNLSSCLADWGMMTKAGD